MNNTNVISKAPASIEGQKIFVTGQKIMPQGRPKFLTNDQNTTVYQLDVSIRGDSTIIEEYCPKLFTICESSMLDNGSMISGKKLWGFSSNPIRKDDINIGGKGRSGAHSGQDLTLNGICFMAIVDGWCGKPLLSHPKQLYLM